MDFVEAQFGGEGRVLQGFLERYQVRARENLKAAIERLKGWGKKR
jgi:hypothetical protein